MKAPAGMAPENTPQALVGTKRATLVHDGSIKEKAMTGLVFP
jgi:hypothetical protein